MEPVGQLVEVPEHRVAHRHARHLAEQLEPVLLAEQRVGGADVAQPCGDRGRGQRRGRRESSVDQRVAHRHGGLHVPAGRVARVGERPDRLVWTVAVGALAERDDDPLGQLRGVKGADDLVGLPRVHRHEHVVRRYPVAEPRQQLAQLLGEQPLLGELVDAPERRVVAVHAEPAQGELGPGLGCVALPVGLREADPALVQHQPRVPGEVPVRPVVVHRGQCGGGGRAVEPDGLVGDGGGQLAQHVGQAQPGEPQPFPGVDHERARVGDRLLVAGRAARLHVPGLERAAPGAEPVADAVGQHEQPAVAVGFGLEQPLVAQLAEHLVHDQRAGLVPGPTSHENSSSPNVVNAVRSGSG